MPGKSRTSSSKDNKPEIRFVNHPSSVVLINTFEEIELGLVQAKSGNNYNNQSPIKFELSIVPVDKQYDGDIDYQFSKNDKFVFEKSTARAKKTIKLHFKTSTLSGRARFQIRGVAASGQGVSTTPFLSAPFHAARYKLHIITQPPNVWYKDGPQQGKCIEFTYDCVDGANHKQRSLVPGQKGEGSITVQYSLLYEKKDPKDKDVFVTNQKILKFESDCDRTITLPSSAKFHGKISEISKNHMKQNFILRAELVGDAKHDEKYANIGACDTDPITVLSKLNVNKKRKQAAAAATSLASGLLNSDASGPTVRTSVHERKGKETHARVFSEKEIQQTHAAGEGGPALAEVMAWGQFVNTSLERMEWQHVGFEVTQDGNLNLNSPLYRCPGCWSYRDNIRTPVHLPECTLAKSLHLYRTMVIGRLNTLAHLTKTGKLNDDIDSDDDMKGGRRGKKSNKRVKKNNYHASDLEMDNMSSSSAAFTTQPYFGGGPVTMGISGMPSITQYSSQTVTPIYPAMDTLARSASQMGSLNITRQMSGMSDLPGSTTLGRQQSDLLAMRRHSDYDPMDDSFAYEESTVFCIVVKQTPRGFAAFDENSRFVGHYMYNDYSSVLNFLPKDATKDNVAVIEAAFKSQLGDGTPIMSKRDHVTLHSLKEAAFLHHCNAISNGSQAKL